MTATLPVTHLTLYKHGVAFFERRARVQGEEVLVTFREEDMMDVLKSFTALDWGGGQVLGVDYPTPQSYADRLAGSSIQLGEGRSLRDLLAGLRGRRVRLALRQNETLAGTLVGLDEPNERQPLESGLVTLLLEDGVMARTVRLEQVEGVILLEPQAAADLRFFLDAATAGERHRAVRVRLTPGEHDLSVSYVAPAPTWRVSYRLAVEPGEAAADAAAAEWTQGQRALLLGWGVLDNRLEEDLENVSLTLAAGTPISFRYDLYNPYTPERPLVEEEARGAAGPVMLESTGAGAPFSMDEAPGPLGKRRMVMAAMPAPPQQAPGLQQLERGLPVQAAGAALGALFEYHIQNPVSVGRGQSAMVPIVSARLGCERALIYTGHAAQARPAADSLPHPVVVARLENHTGLTLERGPVTVLESGRYAGEALLPFTPAGGALTVPYAVELSITVRENTGARTEERGLSLQGAALHLEDWRIRWTEYRVHNAGDAPARVLVEHPRAADSELFGTPEPVETTTQSVRFAVDAPARGEARLLVSERALVRRVQALEGISYEGLRRFLQKGLIDEAVYARLERLLRIWERIAEAGREREAAAADRESLYTAQQSIRANLDALGEGGREGKLRAMYVEQLEASEANLRQVNEREAALTAEIDRLQEEAKAFVEELG